VNKLLVAIVIALAVGGILVQFRFNPLGSFAYADPPPPISSPP
jgi:hypothetical protein